MYSIAFISNIVGVPWGGAEELWSRSALELVKAGVRVGASVPYWSPPHERILKLAEAGIEVEMRPLEYPLWRRLQHRLWPTGKTLWLMQIERFLMAKTPALVVLSDGGAFPPIDLLELCAEKRLPFVTICHVNHDAVWPNDEMAARYRSVLPRALRCYFVSKANQLMLEKQIGFELLNAEIVRNPFNVERAVALPWPNLNCSGEVRFACVGRLHPPSKGQDILLEALADPAWRTRKWFLRLYGEGPMREGIARLISRLDLEDRVQLMGHVDPVEKIWAENHVLVMPSRYEGLPLAMVEAMLCGRPVVATDVAGHSEIIDDGTSGFLAEAPTVPSVQRALERLWTRRGALKEMGWAAAKSIRREVPADPASIFAQKIMTLAGIQ